MAHTKETLRQDLVAMGLTGTETILIHSSMKSIREVEGGADTVLDVLMEFLLGGCCCCPPTHGGSWTAATGCLMSGPAPHLRRFCKAGTGVSGLRCSAEYEIWRCKVHSLRCGGRLPGHPPRSRLQSRSLCDGAGHPAAAVAGSLHRGQSGAGIRLGSGHTGKAFFQRAVPGLPAFVVEKRDPPRLPPLKREEDLGGS